MHALKNVEQAFQWGGKQHKYFDTLKEKISTAPILVFLDLQQPFEIEIDASGYAMGVVFIEKWKPICYNSENFSQAIMNYPTYHKELYDLVQSIEKRKHYLIGKENMIHTDHRPL